MCNKKRRFYVRTKNEIIIFKNQDVKLEAKEILKVIS